MFCVERGLQEYPPKHISQFFKIGGVRVSGELGSEKDLAEFFSDSDSTDSKVSGVKFLSR